MRRATALGRTSAAIVAVGLVAAALAGCSTDPNTDCGTALPSGRASELISASGKIGAQPKVALPRPIDTTTSQRSILTKGSGALVHTGQQVELGYTAFDGTTGQQTGSGYGSSSVVLSLSPEATGAAPLVKGLQCSTVGSRVAVVVSAKDSGAQDAGSSQVYIFDVLGTSLSSANGAVRPSVSGFPTVVLAPTGQPGLTIPSSGDAPTKVRSEVLKQGDGAEVKKTGLVILQYTAVGWESKSITTTSWGNGGPDLADMASGQSQIQGQQGVLPQSMLKELVGKKVGSQLVIETPKDQSRPAEAWVVDILGVR